MASSAPAPAMDPSESMAGKLAAELAKNRELTRRLYTLRGEAPPNDHRYTAMQALHVAIQLTCILTLPRCASCCDFVISATTTL